MDRGVRPGVEELVLLDLLGPDRGPGRLRHRRSGFSEPGLHPGGEKVEVLAVRDMHQRSHDRDCLSELPTLFRLHHSRPPAEAHMGSPDGLEEEDCRVRHLLARLIVGSTSTSIFSLSLVLTMLLPT